MAFQPKVNEDILKIVQAINKSNTKSNSTKVDYNINSNNLAGVNYAQNANVRGKSGVNANATLEGVKGNPIEQTEKGKTFVPETNTSNPNINELKNAQSTLSKVSDDSNKKAQKFLGGIVNKVKNFFEEGKKNSDVVGQKRNEIIKARQKEKVDKIIDDDYKIWNSATDEEKYYAVNNFSEEDYKMVKSEYDSYNTLLEQAQDGASKAIIEEQKSKIEDEYKQLEKYNALKNAYSELNAYEGTMQYGTKDQQDSLVEAISHKNDTTIERAGSAAGNILAKTINIVPSAIDQMKESGNTSYANEQLASLESMHETGKISDKDYTDSLKYWNDYIEDFKSTNGDNLSQKIRSASEQLSENTYYGTGDVERFLIQAGESTAQFLLHFAIGQGIASIFGDSAALASIAKTALGEKAKEMSFEALVKYGTRIVGGNIATVSMSSISATDKTDQLLKQGVDIQTAVNNGLLTGLTSYAVERIGMDNFVNKVIGGAGDKILGHVVNSIGSQAAAEGLEEVVEGLVDPIIDSWTLGVPYEVDGNELLMSFMLGAVSGGATGLGGAIIGQHSFVVNTRRQYELLKNEMNYLESVKPSMNQDQQIEADYWLRVGNNALEEFASKSSMLGVTLESDLVSSTNESQDAETIVNAFTPDFNNEIDFDKRLNQTRNTILSTTQEMINQKGINMDAEEYYNLSTETRDKIDNFVNSLTKYQRENTIIDYKNVDVKDGKFVYSKGDTNAFYDAFYDPSTGKTVVNPLGNRSMESSYIHETLHSIENTPALYKSITELVDSYFNDENEVNNFKQDIVNMYKRSGVSLDEKTLNSEYYARRVQDLIGNEEFLTRLNNYDSNVFNRMFTDLTSNFKSNDSFINQLQHTFEQAYYNNQKQTAIQQNDMNNNVKELNYSIYRIRALSPGALNEDGTIKSVYEQLKLVRNGGLGYGVVPVGNALGFMGVDNELFFDKGDLKHVGEDRHKLNDELVSDLLQNIKKYAMLGLDFKAENGNMGKTVILDKDGKYYRLGLNENKKNGKYNINEIKTFFLYNNYKLANRNDIGHFIKTNLYKHHKYYANEKSNAFLKRLGISSTDAVRKSIAVNLISNSNDNVKRARNEYINSFINVENQINPTEEEVENFFNDMDEETRKKLADIIENADSNKRNKIVKTYKVAEYLRNNIWKHSADSNLNKIKEILGLPSLTYDETMANKELKSFVIDGGAKSLASSTNKVIRKIYEEGVSNYNLSKIKDATRYTVQVQTIDELISVINKLKNNLNDFNFELKLQDKDAYKEMTGKEMPESVPNTGYTGFHSTFVGENGVVSEIQFTFGFTDFKDASDKIYEANRNKKLSKDEKEAVYARSRVIWGNYRNLFGLTPDVLRNISSSVIAPVSSKSEEGLGQSIQTLSSGSKTSTFNPSSTANIYPSLSTTYPNSFIDNSPSVNNNSISQNNVNENANNGRKFSISDDLTNQNNNVNSIIQDKISNYLSVIAPFRNTQLNEQNRAELVSKSEKAYTDVANLIAKTFGIKLNGKVENIGGYPNSDGEKIRELSWTNNVSSDYETAKLFTCLMGDLAFENQDAVICYKYTSGNEKSNALEYNIVVKDVLSAEKTLRSMGYYAYTIPRDSNVIKMQNVDVNNEDIIKIAKGLGENYEQTNARTTFSDYLEREDRQDVYKEWLEATSLGEWRGQRFNLSNEQIELINQALKSLENNKTQFSTLNNNNEQNDPRYFNYGANPVRNVDIARETETGKTSKANATIANSPYVSDEEALRIQQAVNDGLRSYESQTNEEQRKIARQMIAQYGFDKSYDYAMKTNNIETAGVDTVFCKEVLNEMRLMGLEGTPKFEALLSNIAHRGSMLGQGVQAYATFQSQTPEGKILTIKNEIQAIQEGLNERFGERAPQITVDEGLISSYLKATSDEQRTEIVNELAKQVADQIPPSPIERLNSWRHLAMLFNPRTWIKNYVSNTAFGYVNDARRAIQTVLETVGKVENKTAGVYSPLNKTEKALYNELVNDYNSRYKSFQGKYTTSDVGNLLVNNDFAKEVEANRKQFKTAFMNEIVKVNARFMSDAPAMRKAYAKEYIGYLKSNNLNLNQLSNDQKNEISQWAFERAREITFNAESELANNIGKFANINSATKLAVDSFIPFKRTPINIIKQGIDYSPVGLAKTLSYDLVQLKKGNMTATQFCDNLASGLTGSGIVLLGMLLANLGILRTSDDDENRKKYFDQENGEQDYSISFDGGSYTIDWLDPMIMPLAMGAELSNQDGYSLDTLMSIATAIGDPIFETSMLSGISKNLSGYEKGAKWWGTIIENTLSNYISQYVPTIGGAVARTIDDTRRSTYPNTGILDKTLKTNMNKIPGLSMLNEPYITSQGQNEKSEDLGIGLPGRAVLNFLSPGYYSSKEIDKYDEELYRLYSETGEIGVIPSSKASSTSYQSETYKFTGKQYTQWNKVRLQTESKYVNEFIDSKEYQAMGDMDRAEVIKEIRTYAGKVAKKDFFKSQNIPFTDNALTKAEDAVNHGVSLPTYFGYKKSSGTKQAEKVEYLENTNLSQSAKEYLYSLEGYKKSYAEVKKNIQNKKTSYVPKTDNELWLDAYSNVFGNF